MGLSVGTSCNIPTGTKNMQRTFCLLELPAQCWLTGRIWICALVLLCSKATRGAAWEAQPSMLPQMDVKADCYHPRWFFCLGSANAVAFSQRPAFKQRLLSHASRGRNREDPKMVLDEGFSECYFWPVLWFYLLSLSNFQICGWINFQGRGIFLTELKLFLDWCCKITHERFPEQLRTCVHQGKGCKLSLPLILEMA